MSVQELFQNLALDFQVEEYYNEALEINKKTGDREGKARCYANLGTVYRSSAEYKKAKEYQDKALLMRKEIGDRKEEARCYGNHLRIVYKLRADNEKAEEYYTN